MNNPEHRKYICEVWGFAESKKCPKPEFRSSKCSKKCAKAKSKVFFQCATTEWFHCRTQIKSANRSKAWNFTSIIDFFMSESSRYADVVLPGTTWAEDEGVTASARRSRREDQQSHRTAGRSENRLVELSIEIARRMGRGKYFRFQSPREIFDELRVASKGGNADYYGITYEKIEKQNGVFWMCPTFDHPGTPRLFEDKKFFLPGQKSEVSRRLNTIRRTKRRTKNFRLILTTGRVVYQYLSGNQTRRIGFLVQQCPEPYVEIHPETAMKLKINDGERVKVISRRGEGIFPALVVRTIRPDTIFIPYHWGEELAANQLTNPALDPTSKIPEYKACAARIEKIHSRELPILGKGRKGTSLSEVQRGK